jgi:hypothetical protein
MRIRAKLSTRRLRKAVLNPSLRPTGTSFACLLSVLLSGAPAPNKTMEPDA